MADTADLHFEKLASRHDRSRFTCGIAEIDRYVREQAGQDQKRRTAAVYVLTPDGVAVSGFFTLSASSIAHDGVPPSLSKRLPRTDVPVILLGRMGVQNEAQGKGLGKILLFEALETALTLSASVGAWAVVVDAKPAARQFYTRYGFSPVLDSATRLYLPTATIADLIKDALEGN